MLQDLENKIKQSQPPPGEPLGQYTPKKREKNCESWEKKERNKKKESRSKEEEEQEGFKLAFPNQV